MLETFDEWTESLDINLPVDVLYLDFAKTFDRLVHDGLLKKTHGLGIKGAFNWNKDFHNKKTQRVKSWLSLF